MCENQFRGLTESWHRRIRDFGLLSYWLLGNWKGDYQFITDRIFVVANAAVNLSGGLQIRIRQLVLSHAASSKL